MKTTGLFLMLAAFLVTSCSDDSLVGIDSQNESEINQEQITLAKHGNGLMGKIVFETDRDGNAEIYVMNPDGSGLTNLTNHPGNDGTPSLSHNGRKIAFSSDRDGNLEIYTMNSDGSEQTRLTFNGARDNQPNWSPHGKKIAFTSFRDDNLEVYVMNADGSDQIN